MKRFLFLITSLTVILWLSCSDEPEHRASGQWRLKTMEKNGIVSTVDTVFFSFQRARVFAFTVLKTEHEAQLSYGYMEVPSENQFKLSLDTSKHEDGYYKNLTDSAYLRLYGWTLENDFQQVFTVEKITGKELVLSANSVTYSFKKY